MKRKIVIIILILIVVFIGYNYFKAVDVEVEDVTIKDFSKETVLTGNLILVNQATVKSKISGEIKEVKVTDGQQVVKGDFLMKIDSSEYYQNYTVIEKDVEKAVSALDQYIDLNRDNMGDSDIIHARNMLEVSLQQAKSRQVAGLIGFNNYTLTAPITGKFYFANSLELKVGEYVTLNSVVGKIYNNDKLQVKVGVTPDEFSALEGVTMVKVQIEGYDKQVNAIITQISDAIGKNDNGDDVLFVTFDIFDLVDDIYKKDGLSCKVYIEKQVGNMLSVPFSAVFSEKSKDYLYLVKDNKVIKTEIFILDDFGEYISIKDQNIKENDKVVKINVEGLKDGKRVKYN